VARAAQDSLRRGGGGGLSRIEGGDIVRVGRRSNFSEYAGYDFVLFGIDNSGINLRRGSK